MTTTEHTSVTISAGELVIEPHGLDRLRGLRGALRVPLAHVRGATADTGVASEPKGVRAPGLALPGHWVGTFHRDGETAFWSVSDPQRNVVVEFAHEQLARAVVTVDDPAAVERLVNAAVDALRSSQAGTDLT